MTPESRRAQAEQHMKRTDRTASPRQQLATWVVISRSAASRRTGATRHPVADQGAVTLGAKDVAHVDTAGLQLVAAFIGHLLRAGRRLHWDQPSGRFAEAAANLGLTSTLHLAESG